MRQLFGKNRKLQTGSRFWIYRFKKRAEAQDAIDRLAIDLLAIRTELEKQAEQNKDLIDQVDNLLNQLGIDEARRVKIQQDIGISQVPVTTQEVGALVDDQKKLLNKLNDVIDKDPVNFVRTPYFLDFVKNLDRLEKIDIDQLFKNDPEAADQVVLQINNTYRDLYDNMQRVAIQAENDEDAQVALERVLVLKDKYVDIRKKTDSYMDKRFENSAEKKSVKNRLSVRVGDDVARNLDALVKKITDAYALPIKPDPRDVQKMYSALKEAVSNWNQVVDRYAVTKDSLAIREAILDKVNNSPHSQKPVGKKIGYRLRSVCKNVF